MIITQAQSVNYDRRTETRSPIGHSIRNRWVLKQISQHCKIIEHPLKGWGPYTHLVHVEINLVDGVHGYYHVVAK